MHPSPLCVQANTDRLMYALSNESIALESTVAMVRDPIPAQASTGVAAQAWRLEQAALEHILESQ